MFEFPEASKFWLFIQRVVRGGKEEQVWEAEQVEEEQECWRCQQEVSDKS